MVDDEELLDDELEELEEPPWDWLLLEAQQLQLRAPDPLQAQLE